MGQEHPIRVAARRTGLSSHVIRIWEKRYSAVVPRRSSNRRRFYTDEDIERLMLLRRATLSGRSIGQVATLSREALLDLLKTEAIPDEALPEAEAPAGAVDSFVDLCLNCVGSLDSKELEASLAKASAGLGQPVFIEKFLVRLMSRMGDCWRDGSMRVMHEHLLSSVVRSYLGAIGSNYQAPGCSPLLISTTPSGQLHEVGALAVAATAAADGWRVLYLGPNLPSEEIAGAAHQQRARAVALSILYPPDDAGLRAELLRLRDAVGPEVELIAGGRAVAGYLQTLKEIGVILIDDLTSLRKHLESLRSQGKR